MRPSCLLFLLAVTGSVGCGLFDDHCAGTTFVASDMLALQGSALDAWMEVSCTSDEDDRCQRGLPPNDSLMLCSHDRSLVETDGGTFQRLKCDFYSDAKACHSSDPESHHEDDIPVPPPPG